MKPVRLIPIRWRRAAIVGYLLLFCLGLTAQPAPGKPLYRKGGFSSMMAMGQSLRRGLKSGDQQRLHLQPVSLQTDNLPFVTLEEYPADPQPLRMVFVSVGFIELLNYVGHAKAIDRIEKGYLEKYLVSLAEETGEKPIRPPPRLSESRFWTDEMLNEQESNFNQMAGIILGIELSHHYLGHYRKYGQRLKDERGKPVPINRYLTRSEWEESFRRGVRNALDCGYGIAGAKAIYESLDKMPRRPAWTAYFLPEQVKVSQLTRQLRRLEAEFFGR